VGGHGDVLFLAPGVGEAKIDELDVVVLDEFLDLGSAHVFNSCCGFA